MALVLSRLIVNCKAYPEATGRHAVALAAHCVRVEHATAVPIALSVQAVDVRACVATGARIYGQHFDRIATAQATGATSWESLRDAGVAGSLLNHSERRLAPEDVAWHVEEVRRSKLVSVLCARSSDETRALARLRPSLLAIEPPELIGGSVSVTKADPTIVTRSIEAVGSVDARIPVLCGAGVKSQGDARRAVELGAYGVLVASGVTLAKDPAKALEDLARGLQP